MRILVTGSRSWDDYITVARGISVAIEQLIAAHPEDKSIVIVHGGAKGADKFAQEFANKSARTIAKHGYSIKPEEHKADWIKYGKAAGPIRNTEMVNLGADVCVAFIGKESIGTWDCIRKAEAADIEVLKYFE